MRILKAEWEDLPAILSLQKCAFQSEARLLGTDHIPPLRQTLPELQQEWRVGTVLKAVRAGKIIGSVRAHLQEGTLYIGKLMVALPHRGQGIGERLLQAIEETQPAARYELFTSAESTRNLSLYERAGYRPFREMLAHDLRMVYLQKERPRT